MEEELKELKLEELEKLIKKEFKNSIGTAKDGLKITIESCGMTKSLNGKSYINWEFTAEKDNKIIRVCHCGNRMYDIKKAYAEFCYNIGAGYWHII